MSKKLDESRVNMRDNRALLDNKANKYNDAIITLNNMRKKYKHEIRSHGGYRRTIDFYNKANVTSKYHEQLLNYTHDALANTTQNVKDVSKSMKEYHPSIKKIEKEVYHQNENMRKAKQDEWKPILDRERVIYRDNIEDCSSTNDMYIDGEKCFACWDDHIFSNDKKRKYARLQIR